MADELRHETTRTVDWKAVIAALGFTWVVLLAVAGFFRTHLLDTVDIRIAKHSAEAADKRLKYFADHELRAEGAIGRVAQLEVHCARIQDWRAHIDREADALHAWRDSTTQRLEQLTAYTKADDRRMDAFETSINAIKDRVRASQP